MLNIFKYLGLIIFGLHLQIYTFNIKLLKGTHTILENVNYAPVNGLIYIEENIAEQWYNLSSSQQIKKNLELEAEFQVLDDDSVKFNIEDIKNKILLTNTMLEKLKNTATEDFLMQMFYVAGKAFNVTEADNNPNIYDHYLCI